MPRNFRRTRGTKNLQNAYFSAMPTRFFTDECMPRFRISAAAQFAVVFLWLLPSSAQAGILITVDKATQNMTVVVDGRQEFSWPVSTGQRGKYETPYGEFQPFRMEEEHYSKEWDEAPMPYSIFFTQWGHAIHGSNAIGHLGSRASHGCVRLATKNAAKLFALVKRRGVSDTQVVVLNDPKSPVMVKRQVTEPVQVVRKPDASAAKAMLLTPEQAFGYAPGIAVQVSPVQHPAAVPAVTGSISIQ
jgi:hypothetical protein